MIRLLTFLFGAIFFAALVTLLFGLGETVHVEAFGWQADPPAGIAGAFIAALLFAVGLLVSLYKDFAGLRRRAVLRGVIKRREKGVDALVEAVSSHRRADFGKADRQAQKASRLLDRDDILTLFSPTPTPAPAPEAAAPVAVALEFSREKSEVAPETAAIAPPAEEQAAPLLSPASEAAPAEDVERRAEEALDRDIAAARRVS